MKNIWFLIVVLCSTSVKAQNAPIFKPLRYDEDYSRLSKDTSSNLYKSLKYLPLIKKRNIYLSTGGEIRFQYFKVKNEGWGDEPDDKNGYLFSRFLFHTDLHVGRHFRAFAQLQSSLSTGKLETSPVDVDQLEVHQAFIDFKTNPTATTQLLVRGGRQELSYGSQRIIAVRDGPNNRQSFDGIKTSFTAPGYKIDVFYSHYVAAKKGVFNDGFNKNVQFWGAYLVKNKFVKLVNVDVYYVGVLKNKAVYDDGTGKETRHSAGTRMWGGKGGWKYDMEGIYQFGNLAQQHISAYTASINSTYMFTRVKFKPEVGMKTEFITGDAHYGDNKLNSFNPLFPRGAYFGLASLIGPANLIDIHPSLDLMLTKHLNLNTDYDVFWRYSNNDGIYTPGVSLIYSGRNSTSKYIGQQTAAELVYTPNEYLYFRAEFTWFKAGTFLKEAGTGKDILFSGITAQLKF